MPGVHIAGVSLSDTAKSLKVGESFNLTATVATVSGAGLTGAVKALRTGSMTITVTTEDGAHTATCEVTVTEAGDTPPPTPDEYHYLEATVTVKDQQQRLRVYDPNVVLPEGTTL